MIAIHAGARSDHRFRTRDPEVLRHLGTGPIPAKAIVAVAHLHNCVPTETVQPDAAERHFGDFTPGRFAWRMSCIQPLSEPVPVAGHHKLWTVPPEVLALVTLRLLPPLPIPLLLQTRHHGEHQGQHQCQHQDQPSQPHLL